MPNNQPVSRPTQQPSKASTKQPSAPAKNPGRRLTRDELSRHEREVRAYRILLAAIGVVALLVVSILGFGWWREYVARSSEPVATVAGQQISIDSYARILDFRRKATEQQMAYMQLQLQASGSGSGTQSLADLFRQQIQQLQFSLILLPDQTLDQMIDEKLVRQEAARRGITVSASEIDDEITKNFGDPPTPAPAPTADGSTGQAASTPGAAPQAAAQATPEPTSAPSSAQATAPAAATASPAASATPAPTADVKARVADYLSAYGFSEAEFRSLVEGQLLYQKLETAMGAEVPTSAEQLHARHILVDSEDKAKEIVQELKSGASFEDLAKTESTDPGSKDKGGDLGWFPRGQMVPEFDDAAFQLPLHQVSDPVKTTYGWHIIEVLEKEQNRQLDEQLLSQRKSQVLPEWLDKARTGPEVKRNLTDDDKNWVYKRIKWSPPV